jgi:ParB family chromosome partitioning protein
LAVAQGIENAARQDLSWIERALFAKRMEDAGVKSRDVQAALSIDRAELAKLRGVGAVVPVDLIEAIGRAPKIGRPRWQELAKLVELHPERLASVLKMLSADSISSSDNRFQFVFDGMKAAKKTPEPSRLGQLDVKISSSTARGREFAKFIESRIPALLEEFKQGEN